MEKTVDQCKKTIMEYFRKTSGSLILTTLESIFPKDIVNQAIKEMVESELVRSRNMLDIGFHPTMEIFPTEKLYNNTLNERIDSLLQEVKAELLNALQKHPEGFHSFHEGWAVLKEEEFELMQEVFKGGTEPRSVPKMRAEALQISAMGLRFILNLCGDK